MNFRFEMEFENVKSLDPSLIFFQSKRCSVQKRLENERLNSVVRKNATEKEELNRHTLLPSSLSIRAIRVVVFVATRDN